MNTHGKFVPEVRQTAPSSRVIDIVDDDEAMRDCLAGVLQEAGYRVRAHASAEDLVTDNAHSDSGCVVTDVVLPGMDGIALIQRLLAERDALPIVVISGHSNVPLAIAAMKAGAIDFLEKPFKTKVLLQAIEAGLRKAASAGPRDHSGRVLERLTPREFEVLELLVAGNSNKEIAEKLGVSHRTIEFHRSHIMEKTGSRNLPTLVLLWLSNQVSSTGEL